MAKNVCVAYYFANEELTSIVVTAGGNLGRDTIMYACLKRGMIYDMI